MSNKHFFIFIDSRDKIYGTNTDFSIQENNFDLEPGLSVSVNLDECIFYNLQYPINSTNNTIIFQENSTATDLTFSIDEGNYTGSELATILATELDSAGANTYTVTHDDNTGKFSISIVAPDNFKFIQIDELFGFDVMTTFLSAKTGDNPAILSGHEYVDLMLPGLISQNITSNNNNNGLIRRIPLDVNWGGLCVYKAAESDQSIVVNKEYLNNLRIELKNPDSTFFQLPDNSHLSITLKCTYQL